MPSVAMSSTKTVVAAPASSASASKQSSKKTPAPESTKPVSKKSVPTSKNGLQAVVGGQNRFSSGLCIATNTNGSRCMEGVIHPYVPYCKKCMEKGDPSVAVLPHPKFGKMLAAKRDLPKGYKMALWGTVYSADDMPEEDKEWGFETSDGTFINPVSHPTSLPQFCQCPGPNEKVTVTFNHPHLMMEDPEDGKKRKEKYASMLFATSKPVPKNHQLVMMYADSEKETETFFRERGIERCDVWTKKNPTILKKNVAIKDLKLAPTGKGKSSKSSGKSMVEVKKSMTKQK